MKRSWIQRSERPLRRSGWMQQTASRRSEVREGPKRASTLKAARPLRTKPDRKLAAWSWEVLQRDGNRCQWPTGCTTGDTRIDPHHIAERSLRPDLKYVVANGIALCRQHHQWLPLHRAEAIAMGLLSNETYEAAQRQRKEAA